MKQFEYRQHKGCCRLCESNDNEKAVCWSIRLNGKHTQMILCQGCIAHLKAYVETSNVENQ